MTRKRVLILILFAMGMQLFFLMSANAVTNASATISTDTTWNLAGSLYYVTGSINNSSYGVRNKTTALTVNAQYNWWGSSSGPYHALTNPTGTGNAVSDNVDYSNFNLEQEETTGTDLTRAQLAKMLVEKLGLPLYIPEEPTFSDVPLDYWAAGYIYSVVERGILSGFEDGAFKPELNPVRYRFASLLYRLFCIPEYVPDSPTYSDVSPDHEAYEAIESLTHAGIFRGNPDGTFRPDDTVTESVAIAIFESITTYCGSITGKVTDEQQNSLCGVHVWAASYETEGGLSGTLTDEEGNYTIYGLSNGQYRVTAQAGGRVKKFYNNTLIYDEAEPVEITAGQTTSGINFILEQGGTISGTVTDDQGHPLEGLSLGCGMIGQPVSNGAETDANGAYTIRGLPFGTYKVFSPDYGRWGENDGNWAQEWYNQKADWDQADIVTISLSAPDAVNINFSLTRGGGISGTVTDSQGNPLVNADISLEYHGSGDWVAGTQSDESGVYNFRGIADGNYRIRAVATGYVQKYYNNTLSRDNAEPFVVTGGLQITDINFILESGGTISGVVHDNLGHPLAGISLNSWRSDGYPQGAETGEDGAYTIIGLPFGDYKISAREGWGQNDGNWMRAWYNGKTQDQADLVAVSSAAPNVTGVNFTLTQGGGISGTVTDEYGTPLAEVDVWAEYYESQDWASGTQTDEEGNYTIQGLPAGQYRVGAWGTGRVMKFYNNTLIYDQATPVNVTTGQTTGGVNFILEQGGTISGIVTDSQGNPLDSVSVKCESVNQSYGLGAETDWDGAYTIKGVPFGAHRVVSPDPGRWGENDDNWAEEWYNQKTEADQADPVTISSDNPDATNVNFTLEQEETTGTDLTRAQLAKMLVEKLGLPLYIPEEPTFSDVPLDYWAAGYIYSVVERGILSGFEDGTFKPELNPVRARFAYLLYRLFCVPEYIPDSPTFSDVPSDHYAYEAIESISHAGILGGYPDGTFNPEGTVLKSDAAAIFESIINSCGSISGTVTNGQGNPLSGVDVWAEFYESGDRASGTQTDEDGSYTIHALLAGQYRVGAGGNNGLVMKFYNNTLVYDQAAPVIVTTGQTTGGIDFTLSDSKTVLSAPVLEGVPGSTIPIPVTLLSQGNVSGIQFDLNFRSDLLTFVSGTNGSLTNGFSFTANLYEPGKARVIIYSLAGASIPQNEGPVAELAFHVAAGAQNGQSCDLILSNVTLTDTATNEIDGFDLVNGSFTVNACTKGDINGNSSINVQDVVLAVNIIMGKITPDDRESCAADVNSDGKINVQDVVKIVNIILGKA